MQAKMYKVVLTGGHHNSALAVIDWLNRYDLKFFWIGQREVSPGVSYPEYTEVKDKNIPFYSLHAGKLFRTTSIRYLPSVLINLALIPIGFLQSLYILLRVKPDLIVSFGGYMALPVVITGKILGIKSVTHEQTVVLGVANQVISKFVSKIYTSWPLEYYCVDEKIKNKMVYTGLPLRSVLKETSSKFEFSRKNPVLYITGGKKGSLFINKIILKNLKKVLEYVNIIWSCGNRIGEADYAEIMQKLSLMDPELRNSVYIKEYFLEHEIARVFNTSDFVFTRGGAHTVYEIACLKIPALIVPIPWASNNEQYKNAKVLQKAGVAEIIDQENLTDSKFIERIKEKIKKIPEYKSNFSNIQIELNGQEKLGKEILKILETTA